MSKRSAHPKIDDFQILGLLIQEYNVFWFEIPMHDFIGMAVINCREELFHVMLGFVLGEVSLLDDPIEEFSALAIIHHNIEIFPFSVDIIDADDIWMVLNIRAVVQVCVESRTILTTRLIFFASQCAWQHGLPYLYCESPCTHSRNCPSPRASLGCIHWTIFFI